MRSEAYQAAAAVAVARSDIDRNDPSLITRDFTLRLGHGEEGHNVYNYTPCPLAGSQLIIADKMNCSLSPGEGGVQDNDPRCPLQTCVVVSVRSETWADPVARQTILRTGDTYNFLPANLQRCGKGEAGADHRLRLPIKSDHTSRTGCAK